MTLADIVASLAVVGLVAYAVLGGADFGGGIWDLFAFGPRAQEQRRVIAKAMGPVWEANHVWLIFAVVVVFAAFPPAFSTVSIALFAPLHLAVAGIVLRGAAFVFRSYGRPGDARRWGAIFGASSAITPVLLGMAAAALSSGHIRLHGEEVRSSTDAWFSPLSLALGVFALSLCAYQAAVFLAAETEGDLQEDFRRRALWSGTVVVATSAALPLLLSMQRSVLWTGLQRATVLPVIVLGAGAALASGAALRFRRYRLARVASTAQIGALVVGWALAMRPYLVFPDVTIANAAASETTLRFVLLTTPIGMLLLIPSLVLLFRVFHFSSSPTDERSAH